MSRRWTTVSIAAMALVVADPRQAPVFRASTNIVTVDVSVKNGNTPVAGLTAEDFSLSDNGVLQHVESVGFTDVPVDVTLVVDVSGSTARQLEAFRKDVLALAGGLRPIDRLRVTTLESAVHEVLALSPATVRPPVELIDTGNLSSVYDGIATALLRRADVGRRHLIVVYTDGWENRSILLGQQLLDVAQASEAVLHLVSPTPVPYAADPGESCEDAGRSSRIVTRGAGPPTTILLPQTSTKCSTPWLARVVDATGRQIHTGDQIAGPFKKIFSDFVTTTSCTSTPPALPHPAGTNSASK